MSPFYGGKEPEYPWILVPVSSRDNPSQILRNDSYIVQHTDVISLLHNSKIISMWFFFWLLQPYAELLVWQGSISCASWIREENVTTTFERQTGRWEKLKLQIIEDADGRQHHIKLFTNYLLSVHLNPCWHFFGERKISKIKIRWVDSTYWTFSLATLTITLSHSNYYISFTWKEIATQTNTVKGNYLRLY